MGRQPMPSERRKMIKEIASQMSHRQAAKVLGVSKETVSRVVSGKVRTRTLGERKFPNLREAEAKVTPEGCLNVHFFENWLVG